MKATEKNENPRVQAARYRPAPSEGLTKEQVDSRQREGLCNRATAQPGKTVGRIILGNVCTLFNLINAVLAAAILAVGSYKNLLFLGVVLSNLAIGILQEIRAKRMVDRLSILSAARAHVIREGRRQDIAVDEVVLDDILELSRGGQIAADCVVREGACDVNESLVTGESDPVHKAEGDMLLSGSFVVGGRCRAQAERVGADSYVSSISSGAKRLRRARSEIMAALQKIIMAVSILIIPVGILLFLRQMSMDGAGLRHAVVATAAALIGMIPEGLVLLTSTVMAVSVVRLSRRRVLVQELYCIEALARVDVLCLDKTGTLTQGRMELQEVRPCGGVSASQVEQALRALCAASQDDDPTFAALRARYGRAAADGKWAAEQIVPFSSDKKWSGAFFRGRGGYVLGAPEFVLPHGGRREATLFEQVAACERENRVLLLAHTEQPFADGHLPERLRPLALILLRDVLRPDAADTLRYFTRQGVTLKVISGDSVATVRTVATRAGLPDAHRCIDATSLKTEEAVCEAVERYAVFGRVTPAQKEQMVLALKRQGHTVAMTGDGVNDVLALKAADCSVAMASGSDAARSVSQLVLLDSDFAAMPQVVAEGRRSINNIQRSASLFLVKTIYATLLALLFLLIPMPYPFMPIQLTLTSVFTIGIPSFVLALEPNRDRIRGNFLHNVIGKAVPGAVTIVFNILLANTCAMLFDIPHDQTSTMCVVLTGFTGLLLVARICVPFTPLRRVLFLFITVGFTGAAVLFHRFFSLVRLPLRTAALLVVCMAGAALMLGAMLWLFRRLPLGGEGRLEACAGRSEVCRPPKYR